MTTTSQTLRGRFPLLGLGTLLIAVPVALPLIVLLGALVAPGDDAWLHLQTHLLGEYVTNTLALMALTGGIALVLGTATAWLSAMYRFPGHRWLGPALVLPLALPTYVAGYVYADLLEYAGPVQSVLREATGWGYRDYRFPAIRSLPGAAVVMALVLYPYVYLLARANLEAQSATLTQAAKTLGVSGLKLFTSITLPLARPALAGGTALVLMEAAAEFGVVEHFGVPTLTSGVFRTWLSMGEREAALKLAGWLFIIVAVLVVAEQAGRSGQRFNLPAAAAPPERVRLRGWRAGLATICCLAPVLLGFVVPALVLGNHAIRTGDPLWGRSFMDFAANSLSVAGIAAMLCVAFALWLGYTERRSRTPLTRYGIRGATLGYAVPGLILAIGALAPLTAVDRWLNALTDGWTGLLMTGSAAGLVFVYVARFLTISFNAVQAGLGQIHPAIDDAARTLGAGPTTLLRRIHGPMLRGTLAYAGLLVFIDVMKELPATLIMRPFNFETLATRVYRLAADERLAEASTAAIVIVALSLIPTLALMRRTAR